MPKLGERFRIAREARGLSLSDVAEQVRIRSVYLAAIEDEKWSVIGAPVYIRGFLRTYARFLGLDAEEVVAEFNGGSAASEAPPHVVAAPAYEPERRPGRYLSPLIWAASLVAVLLIALVVFNALTMRQRARVAVAPGSAPTADVAASASPGPVESAASPSPTPSPTPNPSDRRSLELRFTAPSWVRVVVDGNVSMVGTFPAGTAKLFHGTLAKLRVGNAGGVEIYVDGKKLGKLGANGDVVERVYTL
jgi:cytoskeleton protein RodZ